MFEVVALEVHSNIPAFGDLDQKSRKLAMHLLREGIETNPRALHKILGEVLDLSVEKQDELAELLERTTLSSLISLGKLVADRMDFLAALQVLLYDPDSKKTLKERSQLHRILASETWLFGDEYALTVDDKSLNEVLRQHVSLLEREELSSEVEDEVLRADGSRGIVDLMLSRGLTRRRHREHLVIELKAPAVKVGNKEIEQIRSYAFAVLDDERFRTLDDVRWEFWIISNEMNPTARRQTLQAGREPGLLHDDPEREFKIWVKTWADVMTNARDAWSSCVSCLRAMQRARRKDCATCTKFTASTCRMRCYPLNPSTTLPWTRRLSLPTG